MPTTRFSHTVFLLFSAIGLALLATVGLAEDPIAALQRTAAETNRATWGHWGPDPNKYSSWTTHSNRLVPVYTFGLKLDRVRGENSVYRNAEALTAIYGTVPESTLNPDAEYLDQTDIFRLQKWAAESGKRRIVLFVFDGMDWETTRAAAIAKLGTVSYQSGRGTGLAFQDYDRVETDFGFFVSSPHNDGTNINVNDQEVTNPGGKTPGGFDPALGGGTPWAASVNANYLIATGESRKHAYTDSAASATSMTSGIKSYNDSINVDYRGRAVKPLGQLLQEQGFAVGAVSSVPISHATPACAYANNVSRDDYQDITRDMIGRPSIFHPGGLQGLDVVIGGGWGEERPSDGGQGNNYVPGNRYLDAADAEAIRLENGGQYVVVERTAGESGSKLLADAAARAKAGKHRLFGLFGVRLGHLPFQTADGGYDPVRSVGNPQSARAEEYSRQDLEENPVLADMTQAAMEVLEARADRWWLMVEPGDVDWANHSNNIDNSIGAVLSGEAAFQRVTQWIENHGGWAEAAVIVTADHGHYLVLEEPAVLTQQ